MEEDYHEDIQMEEEEDHQDSDSDWTPDDEECENNRNFYEYREMISMGMRYKLSNRVISNLHNATLVDMGIEDEDRYLTPSKVRRLKKKYGLLSAKKHTENNKNLLNLAFDGKKSAVALPHSQSAVEEKIVVVDGVTYKYLDHFIANPGTGFHIAVLLYKVRLNCAIF